jgi:polyferredoxin
VTEVKLPSNRKFGFFFTIIFALIAAYFIYSMKITWAYTFIAAALIFLVISLIKSDALLPLNKLWIRFGLMLGMIVSPLVLGVIFFGLVTPYGVVMRLFGRDELRLKQKKLKTHWIPRSQNLPQTDFTKQF